MSTTQRDQELRVAEFQASKRNWHIRYLYPGYVLIAAGGVTAFLVSNLWFGVILSLLGGAIISLGHRKFRCPVCRYPLLTDYAKSYDPQACPKCGVKLK
jgi:hypothetical protein